MPVIRQCVGKPGDEPGQTEHSTHTRPVKGEFDAFISVCVCVCVCVCVYRFYRAYTQRMESNFLPAWQGFISMFPDVTHMYK